MTEKVLLLGAVAMDVILDSDSLPKDDGFEVLRREQLVPGGSASNVAVTLAGLGVSAYHTGQIGDDQYGRVFRRTLREDGVDDTYLITKEGGTTLHTYIITAPGGKHCIFANLGDSAASMTGEQAPLDIVKEMDCLYVDLFSSEAAIALAREARKHNIPVVYNMQCPPSFMKKCSTSEEDIAAMLSLCSLFISGKEGYFQLTGTKDVQEAMERVQKQYRMGEGVICTAGQAGAWWIDEDRIYQEEVFPVEAVDTTGAGDCFTGGLIFSRMLEKQPKQEALRFANAAAAIKCMKTGPRCKSDRKTIVTFIASQTETGGKK